jgi:predicted alpha/beta hydrolase family esterase
LAEKSHRRIVIVHGLSADSRSDWYQKVALHFRNIGFEVLVPDLPGANAPNLNRWAKSLHELLSANGWAADETLTLIGHSTGCMAVLRFIETLPGGTLLGPTILLAGFPVSLFQLPVFVARRPNPSKIRQKAPNLLCVFSSNDWRVPAKRNAKWFETELAAETIVVENAGHFIRRHGWNDWSEELYTRVTEFLR